jgi:zinc protease
VGNINREDLHSYIERYIAPLPAHRVNTTVIDRNIRFTETPTEKEIIFGQDDVTMVSLLFTNDAEYESGHRDLSKLNVTNVMLFQTLAENIRERLSGVYFIAPRSYLDLGINRRMAWEITFGCAPERIEELTEAVIEQLTLLKTGEFDDRYFESAKETVRSRTEISRRTNEFWSAILTNMVSFNHDRNEVANALAVIDGFTKDDVVKFVNRTFDLDRMSRVILLAEERE